MAKIVDYGMQDDECAEKRARKTLENDVIGLDLMYRESGACNSGVKIAAKLLKI